MARRRCKAVKVTAWEEIRCPQPGCTRCEPQRAHERTFWAAWCDDACGAVTGAESRTEARRLANLENERHERLENLLVVSA